MATVKKSVSAVDRITAEIGGDSYQLTDDISIPFPTKKQIDDLSDKASFYDLIRVVAGGDADTIISILDGLRIGVFQRVVEEFYQGRSPR